MLELYEVASTKMGACACFFSLEEIIYFAFIMEIIL